MTSSEPQIFFVNKSDVNLLDLQHSESSRDTKSLNTKTFNSLCAKLAARLFKFFFKNLFILNLYSINFSFSFQ